MSVKIKLKHSSVVNKAPLPTDLDAGELALNTNSGSPAAYIKDSAGNIVKLAGAGAIGGTPATETAQGIVELATAAETAAGTDNTRAVHPAGLKATLDAHLTPGTSTPPVTPATGATYINTATTPAVINVWNGTAWVPQAGTAVTGGTAPGTPAAGQIWVDTSGAAPATKIWDGTSWVTMTVDTGTQAKLDAQVASVWTRKGTTLLPATTGDLVVADVLPDATATSKGAVQLADAVAVTAGTAGRVVDAAQLKAAVAVENNWDRSSPTGAGALTVTTGSSAITATGAALQNIAVTSSSGAGTGLRVNLTVTGGAVTAASVAATGSGYAVNDTVTIAKAGVAGAAVDIVLKVSGLSGGVVSPANAGDQVHTGTGKLTVGGTAAAPNLQIKADGGIVANTDGLVYDAATKRLAIGTQTPSQLLQLQSASNPAFLTKDTRNNVEAYVYAGNSDANFGTASSHPVKFNVGDSEKARLDTSGRFLVGTSSSFSGGDAALNARIQIVGNPTDATSAAILALGRGEAAANITAGKGLGVISFSDNVGYEFATIACVADASAGSKDYPGRLVFSTTADGASSPTQRMSISSTGTTSVLNGDVGIRSISTASAGTSVTLFRGSHSGYDVVTPGLGTECICIWSNGNVVNTNNSYGSTSDIKLKENIVDANSQWDDLKALQVRKYNFKEGQTHTQIGLIAQEAELVSPGLVSESPDRDAEGNDLGTVTKSVNYSVLYMKAVKALQEAMERIETLEQRLTDAGIA